MGAVEEDNFEETSSLLENPSRVRASVGSPFGNLSFLFEDTDKDETVVEEANEDQEDQEKQV